MNPHEPQNPRLVLEEDHRRLDALLSTLAGALRRGDRASASECLARAERALVHHFDVEEMFVLPALESAGNAGELRREHDALRRELGALNLAFDLHSLSAEGVEQLRARLRDHAEGEEALAYKEAEQRLQAFAARSIAARVRSAVGPESPPKHAAGERIEESDPFAKLTSFVRPVVQVHAGEPIVEAARRLRDERVGCLVVTQDRRPIGILTDRDLAIRVVAEGRDVGRVRVEDVVTYSPFTLSEGDSVDAAVACMKEHGVRRLPIVAADGSVTGIVTADDIIVGLGRQLSAVSAAIANPSDAEDSR